MSIWHIFDVNTDSSYSATLKKHMFLGFTMVTILYVKFFVLYVFPIVIASHDSKFDDKIGECKQWTYCKLGFIHELTYLVQ